IAAAQHIDEVAHLIKPLGRMGTIGDGTTVIVGFVESAQTLEATPAVEAVGSFAGGALGGAAGGALAGSVVAGPVGTVVGGAIGGLAGSELGKKLGHEIGEIIDESELKQEVTDYLKQLRN
ncbi:MAG: hypothetical protein Q4D85_08050, partial [Corynebacterium sp.]|nr:hypothetical protein [Corynebacterium sp.]